MLILSVVAATADDQVGDPVHLGPTVGQLSDQAPPIWLLVEEIRIGSLMADRPDALSAVGAFAVDGTGRVWIYDRQEHHIKVFAPDGRYVKTIGRSGAGPGEFKAIIGMAWGRGAQLWVVDAGNARYSVFDTSGALLADYRRPVQTYAARWVGGFDDQGRFFDQAYLPATRDRLPQALIQVSEGNPVDTIMLPDYASQAALRGSMRFPLPFSRRLVVAFDPRGFVWYGVTDQYRITRRALQDTSEFAFNGPAEARALSSAEEDSVKRYLRSLRRELGVSYSETAVPRVHPVFEGLYLASDGGQVWVKRADRADGSLFDVFDRGGRLQAQAVSELTLLAVPAPVIMGDQVWAVALGEFDVHYVVRLALMR